MRALQAEQERQQRLMQDSYGGIGRQQTIKQEPYSDMLNGGELAEKNEEGKDEDDDDDDDDNDEDENDEDDEDESDSSSSSSGENNVNCEMVSSRAVQELRSSALAAMTSNNHKNHENDDDDIIPISSDYYESSLISSKKNNIRRRGNRSNTPFNNYQLPSTGPIPLRLPKDNDDDDDDDDNEDGDDDDDCRIISESEHLQDQQLATKKQISRGMHMNDAMNAPDAQGRVLVNLNHPSDDKDIFLLPFLARNIKSHQIGGIRFLYDNIVETLERVKDRSSGFGCILA